MRTKITAHGRIVVPAQLRAQDDLRAGDQFEITRVQPGEYLLKKVIEPGQPGLAAWLQRCPEQGWFQPIPSETTDTIGPPKRRARKR